MIYLAFIYMLTVWLSTFPALWLRLLKARDERQFNQIFCVWATIPALILLSPALILGYVLLWMLERFLRKLVIISRATWRAWLAIGRPAAAFSVWVVQKLTGEIP
jgi:hypothetical protein